MSDQKESPQDTLLPKELNINFKDNSPKGGSYKPSLWLRFLEGSERIAKILGALAIPCVLAYLGYQIDLEMQNRTLSKEYMTIALDILKNKNSTDPNLYAWAVDLLDENAPSPMGSILKEKLKNKTVRLMSAKDVYETYQNSDPSAAVKEYSRILEKGTNEATLFHRAAAYRRVGKLDSAMMDYNQLLTINPIHNKGYNKRALLWMQKEEQDSACVDFKKAIQLGSTQAIANASIYCPEALEKPKGKEQKKYIEEITSVNQLIKGNPKNDRLYVQRANIHRNFKNWQAAHDDWGVVITFKPNIGEPYYQRGLLKVKLNKNGACADLKRALELGYNAQKMLDKYCSPK